MRSNKYFLSVLAFILSSFILNGQPQVIDSLKSALKNARHDTMRCEILNQLTEYEADVRVWPMYNDQLLKLAQKALSSASPTDKSIYLKYLGIAYNNSGFLANLQGDIPKAINYHHKSMEITIQVNDKMGTAVSLNNIGLIYQSQGDLPRALEYYHKSLKIQEETGNKHGIADAFNNIGTIHQIQGDVPNALKYHNSSLKIREEIKDKQGIANSLSNIGLIYYDLRDLPKALDYHSRCLKIQEEINNTLGIAAALNSVGSVYAIQDDYTKALEYFHKSLKIHEETNYKDGVALSLNYIASAMAHNGDWAGAQKYAERSLATARDLGYPQNIKFAAVTLSRIYRKQNKFKEALEMYELEIEMRDSIVNGETKKAALKKQFQYDYEKKQAVADAEHKSEMEKQKAVADEKNRKQNIVIWSVVIGLLLVIVFSGLILKSLNTMREQKRIIELKNKETEMQKHLIEEKQKEIIDSITYAQRIQRSLLPTEKYIRKVLDKS